MRAGALPAWLTGSPSCVEWAWQIVGSQEASTDPISGRTFLTLPGLYRVFDHPEGETFLSLAWPIGADIFAKKHDEAKRENSVYFKSCQVHQIGIPGLPKASRAWWTPILAAPVCVGGQASRPCSLLDSEGRQALSEPAALSLIWVRIQEELPGSGWPQALQMG